MPDKFKIPVLKFWPVLKLSNFPVEHPDQIL